MVPLWNELYNISNDYEVSKVFGPILLNHKLFRPRLYNNKIFESNKIVDINNRYNNSALKIPLHQIRNLSMNDVIITKFNSICNELNFDNYIVIDKQGNIKPLKKI